MRPRGYTSHVNDDATTPHNHGDAAPRPPGNTPIHSPDPLADDINGIGDLPAPSPEELMASIASAGAPASAHPPAVQTRSVWRRLLPTRGAESRVPDSLLLLWCAWLLATWVFAVLGEVGLPPIRWMILSAILGVMALWPLMRLMQDLKLPGADGTPRNETRAAMHLVLRDWFALIAVFHVVVWALRITAGWSFGQALVLIIAATGWSLLAGAIIAWACSAPGSPGSPGTPGTPGTTRRTVAMAIIMLLLVGEPALMAIININAPQGHGLHWPMRVSPIETIWVATGRPADWVAGPWIERATASVAAACIAWTALAWTTRSGPRKS